MEITTSSVSLNIHRETDVLALARAEKKKDYWRKVVDGKLQLPIGKNADYAEERLIYWIKIYEKYRARIEGHINDFEKIKDPVGFMEWIAGVINTIKAVINLIINYK